MATTARHTSHPPASANGGTAPAVGEQQQQQPFLNVAPANGSRGERADQVRIEIGGALGVEALPSLWRKAGRRLRRLSPRRVEVDVSALQCADSACLALISEIRRQAARHGGEVTIVGVGEDLKTLIGLANQADPLARELRAPPRTGFVSRVGNAAHSFLAEVAALVSFVGELCAALVWAAFHPREVRWRDFLATCEQAGANAVPVIIVLGLLIGVMLAFQSAEQTDRYGVRTVVPSVVTIAVTRELGPLITSLLLAGRTTSALAAEFGTMKINDELSALRAMGLDPVRFLVLPRVLAVMLIAPVLTTFCNVAGILGGYTVMADHGATFVHYAVMTGNALSGGDVFGGLGKTVVAAACIAGVGCLGGLRTGSGAHAVGSGTTRAVVLAILLVVAIDGSFGVAYYYLGI